LGEIVSANSIKRILREHGVEPPKGKGKRVSNGSWKKFIAAHMDCTVAVDFFTSPVLTWRGIVDAYSLVFIHHGSRRVWISLPTLSPDEDWVCRQFLGAIWWFEDQGITFRYLIRDRDRKFSAKFDEIIKDQLGHKRAVIKTSVRAPDMNAFVESFLSHAKSECHNNYWYFRSLDQLGRANSTYMTFHNEQRPHQSKSNNVLSLSNHPPVTTGNVKCQKLLGGLLQHYYRDVA